ncbi:MAG: hypothetical protein WCL39_01405 [Armatimonadota bacterium]
MKNRTGFALLAATVVLGTALSASAAPVTSTITLGKGWNMITLPTVPLNPDPLSVLNDLNNLDGIDGNVARWDPITRSMSSYSELGGDFGNMLIGDGYWVLKTSVGTLNNNYQGVDVSGDHWISLPRKGWTLMGYPNNTPANIPVGNCSVTNGIETKTFDDAVVAGWIADKLQTWDNNTRSMSSVGTDPDFSDDTEIRKGKGYWFQSLIDNLALIIPGS